MSEAGQAQCHDKPLLLILVIELQAGTYDTISPLTIFTSWVSLSMEVFRIKCPTLVILGAFFILKALLSDSF